MKNTLVALLIILITVCSACDEGQQMMKPALTPIVQDPTDPTQAPTVRSDASQPLTKRDKLTHAIYTSEKLLNAYDSGRFELFQHRFPTADPIGANIRFEPTVWGNAGTIVLSKEFSITFTIVVHDIEYKNGCVWYDEFNNLRTNFKDDPDFSRPVAGQLIDKTTNAIVRSFSSRRWRTTTVAFFNEEGQPVYPSLLDENGVALTQKEKCKIDNSEIIYVAMSTVPLPHLTPESWENRFQLIDAVIEKLKIRIHLEDGSFFDYDFKELFPNPVVIGVQENINQY